MDNILTFLKDVDYVSGVNNPYSKTGKPSVTKVNDTTKLIEGISVRLSDVNVNFIAGGFVITSDVYDVGDSLVFLYSKVYSSESIYVVDSMHYVSTDLIVRKK